MRDIALAAVPNQSLSVQLDGRFYDIAVRDVGDTVAFTISRDGETLISGARAAAGTPLLPYRYQEDGNFVLTVEGDALPYWDQFGVTQFLVFVSADELAEARG